MKGRFNIAAGSNRYGLYDALIDIRESLYQSCLGLGMRAQWARRLGGRSWRGFCDRSRYIYCRSGASRHGSWVEVAQLGRRCFVLVGH
jgi:hypothetical protein